MKKRLLFFFFYSVSSYSQIPVQGFVKDLKTKTPIPYCAVSVKGTGKGCITNEDGAFRIFVNPEKDSLSFSYIGYKTRDIPAALLVQNAEVLLVNTNIQLKEVVIHGDDDYLYIIMEKCRKKIKETPSHVSKAYFNLETEIQEQPVEMLECYYNAFTNGSSIEKLLLKNGRIGLAEYDHGFFHSHNTSKAISYLDLTGGYDYLPSVPLQYNKSKLKKLYALNLVSANGEDNMYGIAFTPRTNTEEYFKGEAWIDKETFSIMKINLVCERALIHPFLPYITGDSVSNVSIYITQTYSKSGNQGLLNHINYKYRLEYKESARPERLLHSSEAVKNINTSCVMYFYDYEKPFLLPYFKYDHDLADYYKILSLPYNEGFWNNRNELIFTERQNKILAFLEKYGVLFNFKKSFTSPVFDNHQYVWKGFFEYKNVFWSDTSRLSLNKNNLDSLLRKNSSDQSQKFLSDLYHLKARIFLDVNPEENPVQHFSATVFDVSESYYNLPVESYTDCFINIYFDICEIERRKMEKTLNSCSWNVAQIDSVYHDTLKKLDSISELYFKNVQSGKNTAELYNWNKYILESLNIDNAGVFRLKGN